MKPLLFALFTGLALSSVNAAESRYAMFAGILIYDGKPFFGDTTGDIPPADIPPGEWSIVESASALRIRIKRNRIKGTVTFKKYTNFYLVEQAHFYVSGYLHGRVRKSRRTQSAAVILRLDRRYIFRGRIEIEKERQPYKILSASGVIRGEKKSIDYNGGIVTPLYY